MTVLVRQEDPSKKIMQKASLRPEVLAPVCLSSAGRSDPRLGLGVRVRVRARVRVRPEPTPTPTPNVPLYPYHRTYPYPYP